MAVVAGTPSPPEVSYGTGTLAYSTGGAYTDVGNVTLVDFSAEGSPFPVFLSSTAESPALAAVHSTWRIRASGDSYTLANLALLTNGNLTTTPAGGDIELPWISEPTLRRWSFTKDGYEGLTMTVQMILWRAYIEIPFTYSFSQDELSYHEFSIVALPDFTNGSTTYPFGIVIVSGLD